MGWMGLMSFCIVTSEVNEGHFIINNKQEDQDMKETLKTMFYIGAGAAFLTKEKLEELKTELIEKGKVTQEEGKQLLEELTQKSEDAKNQLDKKIQTAVAEQLKKFKMASSDDVAELKSQVEELKAMLEKLNADK